MKIKIASLYTPNYAQMGDVSSDVNRRYATRHQHEFVCYHHLPDRRRAPSWNKLCLIEQELNGCDWLLWLDADAIIVNPAFTLPSFLLQHDKDFLVSQDYNGMCCGVFFLRNCRWSYDFIRTALFLGEMSPEHFKRFDPNVRFEQNTIKAMVQEWPSVAGRVELLPESFIQNPSCPFNSSAFAMHYWAASATLEGIEAKMRKVAETGWWSPEAKADADTGPSS